MGKVVMMLSLVFLLFLVSGCDESVDEKIDEHGCLSTAGYQWCEYAQQCQRLWEEPCETILAEEPIMEETSSVEINLTDEKEV